MRRFQPFKLYSVEFCFSLTRKFVNLQENIRQKRTQKRSSKTTKLILLDSLLEEVSERAPVLAFFFLGGSESSTD